MDPKAQTMMQAVIFKAPGNLSLEQVPEPLAGAGEVLLRVGLAGVCATDLHIYRGHFRVAGPRILGHEVAGVVEAVGPGVDSGWLGKTCGVRPAQFCGECEACRNGREEYCLNFQCLGNTRDGGYAGKCLVKAEQLVDLPGLELESLVWLEPLACVMRALELAQVREGECMLVTGAGVLGQLFVKALRASGSSRVAVVDPNPEKIELARRNGAEQGWVVARSGRTARADRLIRAWSGNGPQVVIETSGKPEALRRATRWAGLAGRIILFGVPEPEAQLNLKLADIFHKGLRVLPCNGMTVKSFQAGADLLASRRLDLSGQPAVHIDLPEVAETFREAKLFGKGKIFIHPAGGTA
ncbi:MAG TPA: alcohol dehydrogenase catalytic domain-containing protein [Anaerolineales bacterium]|jgi:threonine dehydrogenase-like Zn-dependent dehydrogenase